jgi:alkylation response protein AidB-like acyl-CoA dehydrogenase
LKRGGLRIQQSHQPKMKGLPQWPADSTPDAAIAVALAKGACSDTAVLASQETIQLHEGIGFTWEHPAHLSLKRANFNYDGDLSGYLLRIIHHNGGVLVDVQAIARSTRHLA